MEKSMKHSKVETRRLVRELRKLKEVKAPSSFLPAVLMRTGLADASWHLETPIGPMFIAYNKRGISAILRARNFPEFERSFRLRFGRPVYPVKKPPADLIRDVSLHLSGERRWKLRFDLHSLSEFERSVLLKTLTIPRAEVRPYAWIAREIGSPGAVRAVGSVLAKNPLPLLIPCHRVTRSDGHLGGYGFGNEAKRAMLSAEGIDPDELERLADSGVRYYGSKRTHIFCFPTCHSAKRISERHRIPFRSETEATRAGYRPCKICRPLAMPL
jgi:O-6-methylguanine DNA methyltransferase